MYKIDNISKIYEKNGKVIKAVDDLSLELNAGDFCIVHGQSGSGKSTLLMMLGGMMTPDSGNIKYNDTDIYNLSSQKRNLFRRKKVGFLFQKFHLLPYFDVYKNIKLSLSLNKKIEVDKKIKKIVDELGLSERLKHKPAELSIGQQQRVSMARAIVHEPDIIFADEPTGNLDEVNRDIIINKLLNESKKGKIIMIVTHDKALLDYANKKIELKNGKLLK